MSATLSRRGFLTSAVFGVVGIFALSATALAQTQDRTFLMVTYGVLPSDSSDLSWYGDSFRISSYHKTKDYYFDGNNIGIEFTVTTATEPSFHMTLCQGARTVGSTSINARGFVRAEWFGVEPGNYGFKFTNTTGSVLNLTDVAMFSW